MNFYSFHIGDYMTKTRHLSWEEDIAYRRLIDVYYGAEKPLPADKRAVYRLIVAVSSKQKQAVDAVLAEFFELQPDGYHNERCDAELAAHASKRDKAKAAAMLSVQAREMNNKELRSGRIQAARAKATHTKEEWQALLDASDRKCVKCGGPGPIEKDHIVPIYQGGTDGIENLQPLCRTCNAAKGPDSTDHRSPDWRDLVERSLSGRSENFERTLSERSAPITHYPLPNTQKEGGVGYAREIASADLEAKLREAAGWQSEPAPNLAVTGPIEALIESGADLERDVLPVVTAIAPQATSRTSWKYFVKAIARARDERIAAAKIVTHPSAMRPANGSSSKPSRAEAFAILDDVVDAAIARAARGGQADDETPDRGVS
jgi:uncharacterized protein YdaU (DUF1376 family)